MTRAGISRHFFSRAIVPRPFADHFPAVGFEDGAVGRRRGVEGDLGPYRLSLLSGFLFVLSGDDESARRELDLVRVAGRLALRPLLWPV